MYGFIAVKTYLVRPFGQCFGYFTFLVEVFYAKGKSFAFTPQGTDGRFQNRSTSVDDEMGGLSFTKHFLQSDKSFTSLVGNGGMLVRRRWGRENFVNRNSSVRTLFPVSDAILNF